MMNGDFVAQATSLEDSQTLRAVVEFPLMSDAEKLETLFLATLSRRPTPSELESMSLYLKDTVSENPADGAAQKSNRAYSDIYWALLNSSEFLLNH